MGKERRLCIRLCVCVCKTDKQCRKVKWIIQCKPSPIQLGRDSSCLTFNRRDVSTHQTKQAHTNSHELNSQLNRWTHKHGGHKGTLPPARPPGTLRTLITRTANLADSSSDCWPKSAGRSVTFSYSHSSHSYFFPPLSLLPLSFFFFSCTPAQISWALSQCHITSAPLPHPIIFATITLFLSLVSQCRMFTLLPQWRDRCK